MTNLLGSIAFVVTTNWVTVAVEKPICHDPLCKYQHYDSVYQTGMVTTNTVLNMTWKGQQREILIESGDPVHVYRVGKVAVVPESKSNSIPPLLISKPKK